MNCIHVNLIDTLESSTSNTTKSDPRVYSELLIVGARSFEEQSINMFVQSNCKSKRVLEFLNQQPIGR